jgi:two-component system, cell cycle response regulator
MAKPLQHRVLLIGDADRELSAAVAQAMPGATLRHAATVFDGIAELTQENFATVLANAEPVSQRPEAAVRARRQLTGEGRLVLFGDVSLEPVSRKMLPLGCDDYLITPVTASHILEVIAAGRDARADEAGPLRLHTDYDGSRQTRPKPAIEVRGVAAIPAGASAQADAIFAKIPVADILLDALLEHPGDAIVYALSQFNARLAGDASGPPAMQLSYSPPDATTPVPARSDQAQVAFAMESAGTLILHLPAAQEAMGHALLADLGPMLAKAAAIQHRQSRLQKLAFTDDLTGLFNCRYFKHFLGRTLTEARKNRFPVTLFLFDIDNFKSYNDRFGHGVGDDILKQAANLMRRCVRDHDLVARIGGDEFAVVFWEKDGPRTARDAAGASSRPPSEPHQILARFRKLLEAQDYPLLGSSGRGTLTISGGLAVFPYDAPDMHALIEAADKALMMGAKRSGRNSIQIVGGENAPDGKA